MKVLFAASEAAPYIRTSSPVNAASVLPKALSAFRDTEVRIFLPYYKAIQQNPDIQTEVILRFNTPLSWRNIETTLHRAVGRKENIQYYFIDSAYHFHREEVYGYGDDPERFAFFSKAVLECLQQLNWYPDIIHANDWQTALMPVFLKTFYQGLDSYQPIRTLFAIHDPEHSGIADRFFADDVLGLPRDWNGVMDLDGHINLTKGAILTADRICAYAGESNKSGCGHGLHEMLSYYNYKLSRVQAGIDPEEFNPADDPLIHQNFSFKEADKKLENKRFLQEKLGLPLQDDIPLILMADSLFNRKDFNLIRTLLNDILAEEIQLMIVGADDDQYRELFIRYASAYPQKLSVLPAFGSISARQAYAGSDMMLISPQQDSGGLTQLISMRYGTIPITLDADDSPADDIRHVLTCYQDKERWEAMRCSAMTHDCQWAQYIRNYRQIYLSMI